MDKARRTFEETFSRPPFEFEMDKYNHHESWPGSYRNYHVQCAWEGWQEAKKRKSLTEDQIAELAQGCDIQADLWRMGSGSLVYSSYCNGIPRGDFVAFVRAIERFHGIID